MCILTQGSFKRAYGLFQGFFNYGSFLLVFKRILELFQECFEEVSRNFRSVSWALSDTFYAYLNMVWSILLLAISGTHTGGGAHWALDPYMEVYVTVKCNITYHRLVRYCWRILLHVPLHDTVKGLTMIKIKMITNTWNYDNNI